MKSARRGFTLIEVLIVIIVLGILAAIVVPQFSDASTDAKLNSLKTNLQVIRGQIELYKIQHNETLPQAPGTDTFTNQMIKASKVDGTTAAIGTAGYNLGPYLQSIPNNPYTGTSTVGSGGVGTSAWYYDPATGLFRANHHADYLSY